MYLTGSYCDGGLRPESDLDVLLITRVPLQVSDRRILIEHLLKYSGGRATDQPGPPIELTSLVLDDIKPWRYRAMRDFLFGEWLRADYEAGHLPRPVAVPTSR
jgi:predicted nucleotidyltransferase